MAPILFGFAPRNRGATKQAVKTSLGELEPVEPSRIKVFANSYFSPGFAMLSSLLGLMTAIFSFPSGFFIHTSAEGLVTKSAAENFLPFKCPGLAVAIRKGKSVSTENAKAMEASGFTTMQLAGTNLWVKENAERADYLLVSNLEEIDPKAVVPARYLSVASFREFLLLRSITTRICELFHYLSLTGSNYPTATQRKNSAGKKGWLNARTNDPESVDIEMEPSPFEFEKAHVFTTTAMSDLQVSNVLRIMGSTAGVAVENSGALVSIHGDRPAGVIFTTDLGKNITSHGLLFKFNPQLACPDVNLIGDILGRHFLKALGDDMGEQFEALSSLKSGLSALRLTRVGDELTHLYKCIEIAIDCHAGLVPIFTRNRYEGSLVAGGPGATVFINGAIHPFQPVTSLKADYLNFSEHTTHLNAILRLLPQPQETEPGEITDPQSMYDLRLLCLSATVTSIQREEIVRRAAHLDFGEEHWVISPARLRAAFDLISLPSTLAPTDPIGRLSLFSTDPVLVALSCFGEQSCPSWDIPSGVQCSLKKPNPPTPPQIDRKKGSSGVISDAAWTMVVQTVDLMTAVSEFRSMATTLTYRSTSSQLAKKVGNRSFNRERMAEFWPNMRQALQAVNPLASYEEEGEASKRSRDSSDTNHPSVETKRRRLEV